jgi:hypothetical protein
MPPAHESSSETREVSERPGDREASVGAHARFSLVSARLRAEGRGISVTQRSEYPRNGSFLAQRSSQLRPLVLPTAGAQRILARLMRR